MGCCGNNEAVPIELKGRNGQASDEQEDRYCKKKEYDPTFKGPIKDRSCTDIICCVLFVFLIIAMAVIGCVSFTLGNPKRLLYPTDSLGNSCGTGNYTGRKNLFFFDLLQCIPKGITDLSKITSCPTWKICVKNCPMNNTVGSITQTTKSQLFCKYNTQKRKRTNKELVDSGACAKYTLESKAVFYRCVPTVAGKKLSDWLKGEAGSITINGRKLTEASLKNGTLVQAFLLNVRTLGGRLLRDVIYSWKWIAVGFGVSVVASFLYIMIMRWVAGILVWLTTYAVLTVTGYGAYYCYTEYKRLAATDKSEIGFEYITDFGSYKGKKETWMVGGVVCSVVLAVLVLLLLALRKRITLAIQLLKEGSRAITAMLSTLVFPIFPWLLQLMLLAWFVVVMLFLSTASAAEFKEVHNGTLSQTVCKATDALGKLLGKNRTISCDFQKYNTKENIFRLEIFYIFGWFWVMNFIIALGQCVLAGAFASWFWAWDKSTDVPTFPLLASFGRTFRYHTGSLAFGSLIIAIIQIIRTLLEYIEYKLTGHGQEPGPVVRFLLKCMRCCFWCFEKFMKFLNKNAYIEIAVYGKNFCVSAKNAFFLLMRNILRVAVVDKVTDFLLFIGRLTITAGVGYASYSFFKKQSNLNFCLAPVTIIVIGAWVVSSAFFGVYEMAVNTVFLCFLEDSERHDGSLQRPYYMSKKLRKMFDKRNEKHISDNVI